MLNRYKKHSHISAKKFREIIRYFSLDFNATNAAKLTGISRIVQIVRNCTRAELMPIIQGKILEGSTINTDGWKAYDGLIVMAQT